MLIDGIYIYSEHQSTCVFLELGLLLGRKKEGASTKSALRPR